MRTRKQIEDKVQKMTKVNLLIGGDFKVTIGEKVVGYDN